ncbi:hypothetical protein T261_5368 [Streptomyces lydicus]|nr:hypothetical protein T261_5368 [Streptomyces lydicus]
MFSRKKIAAVSALLGAAAVTCAGATQAYAGDSSGDCTRAVSGDRTCLYKGQAVHRSKDGKIIIKQRKSCSTVARDRVLWPELGFLGSGATKAGPIVHCSNTVRLPQHIKLPHFGI